MKITILRNGEVKLEKVVRGDYEKNIFLDKCKKLYGKIFSQCQIEISLDKEKEKSHFKKGNILKRQHIPKPSPKTFYNINN